MKTPVFLKDSNTSFIFFTMFVVILFLSWYAYFFKSKYNLCSESFRNASCEEKKET